MYDLPNDFDPTCFMGGYLSSICFGVGTIHLNFELSASRTVGTSNPASVVSSSFIRLMAAESESLIRIGEYADISRLGVLLNQDVTSATKLGPRTLQLKFGEAGSVQFEDDGSGYECYQLYVPGSEIIIV